MESASWDRIRHAFDAASDLAPSERQRLLAELPPEVRREVESLLSFDGGDPLEAARASVHDSLTGYAADQAAARIAQRIGPYRVLSVLGQGGMGMVYEAVRDDDVFEKRVAVKVLPPWLAKSHLRERFLSERRILARLEHPGIARVLDGGETADGMPFLVMELIEGEPIDQWCKARELTVRNRVALFRQVCGALEYAHRQFVVHRDVKPANILVTVGGGPKLVDFGIARMLDTSPAAETTSVLMTPHYASPAQLEGEPASVGDDVYSCGAVLYRILTGSPPHDFDGATLSTIVHTVCQEEAKPPSQRAPHLARELRGDLDHIVRKALRKDPAARYQSMEQFAADLDRYLENLPVLAHQGSLRYRASKFLRRNALAVAAAVAMATVVAGGVAATLQQARRADHRFRQLRTLARTLIYEVHDKVAPLPGATAARELILQSSRSYLDSLAAEAGNDVELLNELAGSYARLGDLEAGNGNPNLGKTGSSQASYDAAVRMVEKSLTIDAAQPAQRAVLARILVRLASNNIKAGDLRGALDLAVRARKALTNESTADPAVLVRLGDADLISGDIEARLAGPEKAIAYYRRALASYQHARDASDSPSTESQLIHVHVRLGRAYRDAGKLPEALEQMQQEFAIWSNQHARAPSVRSRRGLLIAHAQLAEVYANPWAPSLGQASKALDENRQALDFAEALFDASDARSRHDLAETLLMRSDLLRTAHRAEALALAGRAAALYDDLYRHGKETIDFVLGLGEALCARGALETRAGVPGGRAATQQGLTILEEMVKAKPDPQDLWIALAVARLRLAEVSEGPDRARLLEQARAAAREAQSRVPSQAAAHLLALAQ
ncbi:MAG: serine/threonine-protein kinase [Bryobacteraceae bacterium]